VGRPWAIGAAEGGHKSVHPELGTLEDFKHLVRAAAERRLELALDLAFQCSPDHPYIREHPEWFSWRPDRTLKTAENPPKRYQDIVNFDFMGRARESLWQGVQAVGCVLDRRGSEDLPSGQSTHQAAAFLGLADLRGSEPTPGGDFPRRGLYPAEADDGFGESGLHPVVHLFHLAQLQARAGGLLPRAHPRTGSRIHARKPVAGHARHSSSKEARPRSRSD